MANNSLLDLETARRRLEELDRERQGLSDLIRKLKQIRDTMASLQADVQASQTETEGWLIQIEKTATEVEAKAQDANKSFSNSIQSFNQKADALLSNFSRSADQILAQSEELVKKTLDQVSTLESRLQSAIEERLQGFQTQFEAFRNEHFESLDRVLKAYERMRVSYDTVRSEINTLEDAVTNFRKEMNKSVHEINEDIEEVKQAVMQQDLFVEKLKTQFDGLEGTLDRKTTELSSHIREVQNGLIQEQETRGSEVATLLSHINKLGNEFEQKSKSLRQNFLFLWLGVILAILLGGVSVLLMLGISGR
jgi:DNA repair exonuclease SbcCD ATPase subunit